MSKALGEVLSVLKEPDTTSSLLPLIIVVGVFLAISTILILYILRQLRTPGETSESEVPVTLEPTVPADLGHPEPLPVSPTMREKIIKLLARWKTTTLSTVAEKVTFDDVSIPPIEDRHGSFEFTALHVQIERLEIENLGLRDQHAKSLGRIDEMRREITRLEKLRAEDARQLQQAHEKRIRAQSRSEEIEIQLQELIEEVELLYKANAQAETLGSAKRLEGIVSDLESHGLSPEQALTTEILELRKQIETQNVEIDQLKKLLLICREQIVMFTRPTERPISKV